MFNAIENLIRRGLDDGVFPGAAIAIGDKNGEMFRSVYGFRQIKPEKKPLEPDTVFDIASLTKIISSIVALRLVQEEKLRLADTLDKFFDIPASKITIYHLMTHTSGLPAHAPLWQMTKHPGDVIPLILGMELQNPPGLAVEYSCLGYILLGKICEMLGGNTLDKLSRDWIFAPLGLKSAAYNPERGTFAVTEFDVEAGWLDGVVHDENARFIGGVSGNAGVFADIADMSALAKMLANKGVMGNEFIIHPLVFDEAVRNHTTHCEDGRGLGFEVRDVLGKDSYGHTGFTGTSLWVDAETSLYVVLLTNRVHPTRENAKHIPFRRELHDLCANEYRELCAK
ncbi:MAG: beta-lactamase family protein [Defluviitaleaceae bacterium]|nr:beta-lactamase family protein [Defluviitaleaceae bacterium]